MRNELEHACIALRPAGARPQHVRASAKRRCWCDRQVSRYELHRQDIFDLAKTNRGKPCMQLPGLEEAHPRLSEPGDARRELLERCTSVRA